MFSARESNAHTVFNFQKPYLPIIVAPNKGEQDNVIFFSLKIVYDSDSGPIKLAFRHKLLQLKKLTRI